MTSSADNPADQNPALTLDPPLSHNTRLRLEENAFLIAQDIRKNYIRNTTKIVADLRQRISRDSAGRKDSVMRAEAVDDLQWENILGEAISFIDGGVGRLELAGHVPIFLRVGSYTVRPGEQRLSEREDFAYYPVVLGDLEGGSKERRDFPDIVRITAELLGGLAVLERTKNLGMLMFHGPLVYQMHRYAFPVDGQLHAPFTEGDIDMLLKNYAGGDAASLKEEFLREAAMRIYPAISPNSQDALVRKRLFEPLSWLAFLYRRLIRIAKQRQPIPIIAGVVERAGELKEFSAQILLERVFQQLHEQGGDGKERYNRMFQRSGLDNPKGLMDRLGYTDALLMGMILREGERSEGWAMFKTGFRQPSGGISAVRDASGELMEINYAPLGSRSDIGFPKVTGCYIHVSDTTEPVRLEVFSDLKKQMKGAAQRVYRCARLLPQYGFPVGLDIADKYAKIPAWMTDAYSKLIRYHLGVIAQGENPSEDLRKVILQSIYIRKRDTFFRPKT